MEHQLQYMPAADAIPYEGSAYTFSEKDIDEVAKILQLLRFVPPVIVNADKVVIEGEEFALAAEPAGFEKVPYIMVDHLTPDEERAARFLLQWARGFGEMDELRRATELANIKIDLSHFAFDFKQILAEDFGTEFDLPAGEKSPYCVMSLTLHEKQLALINEAVDMIKQSGVEVDGFGNTNVQGNAVYEVVRQWVEQKK